MISIKVAEIPTFLEKGSFFKALGRVEPDAPIYIPGQCFVRDEAVDNVDDFKKMLMVIAFWGLDVIPTELIRFCSVTDPSLLTELVGVCFATMDFAQDLLKIFVPRETTTSHKPLLIAITIGRSEVVDFLSSHSTVDSEAITTAVANGRFDYLKLLHNRGHPWTHTACDVAAAGGHLNCLKYMHENGCSWRTTVLYKAAEKGQLMCMKYDREQGLDWPSGTMRAILIGGNVDMLRYAVENGCPLGYDPVFNAVLHGHVE